MVIHSFHMSAATISIGDIIMMVPMGVEQTVSTEANNRGWDRWILYTYNKTTYQDMAGKREGTDTKIP
jgi:hypothetical protein